MLHHVRSVITRTYGRARLSWSTVKFSERPDLVVISFLVLMALGLGIVLMVSYSSIYGL
jgi:hypothetical protein